MANGNPRLEVEIGAVTSELKRGLAEARTELRKFQKEAGNRNYKTAIDEERLAQAQSRTEAVRYRTEIAKLSLEKRKNQQATTAAAGSYREAQQRLTALGRSIREAQGGFSNTNPLIKQQIREYNSLNDKLKRFDATMGNHHRNVGNYGSALMGAVPALGRFASAAGVASVALATLRDAGRILFEFDSGLKNVEKTTGLARGEVQKLGDEILNLSAQLGVIEPTRLTEYAAVAGQLGVRGSRDILNFTETLAKLETATNIVGEQGATEIARTLTLIEGGVQNVKLFGDEIVNLGNNFAATEKEILTNAESIAQNVGIYKIGRQDVLAFATATKAVGIEAELVGSTFNRTLATFEGAIRTGNGLETMLKLIGGTQAQLSKRFKEDAAGVFVDFIGALNKIDKEGGSVNEQLENLSINAVRDQRVIQSLAVNGYDVLTRAIETSRNSMGSLGDEFAVQSDKLTNSITQIKTAWQELVLSVDSGNGIISNGIRGLAGYFSNLLRSVTELVNSGSWAQFTTFIANPASFVSNSIIGGFTYKKPQALGAPITGDEFLQGLGVKTYKDFLPQAQKVLDVEQKIEEQVKQNKAYWEEQAKSIRENIEALDISEVGGKRWLELNKQLQEAQGNLALFGGRSGGNKNLQEARALLADIQRLTDLIQRDSLSKFDQKLFDINKKYDEIFDKIKDEGLLGMARENMNAEKMKVHLERIVYLSKQLPSTLALPNVSTAVTMPTQLQTRSTATVAAVKFSDELSAEIRKGLSRGIGRAFTDLYNNIDDLGSNFYQVFSNVFQKLSGYVGNIMSDVIGRYLGEKLGDKIDAGDFSIGGLSTKMSTALVAGAQMAGKVLGGMISREDAVGQGVAGALSGVASGAAAGAAIGGTAGGPIGAVIGGVVGLLGGIFGAKEAKRQRELQEQQLAEQKKQTALMERQAMLAYSASVVGQQVNEGVVTAVERDAYGNLVAKINGKDIELVLERTKSGRG